MNSWLGVALPFSSLESLKTGDGCRRLSTCVLFDEMLGLKPRSSYILDTYSILNLHPQPINTDFFESNILHIGVYKHASKILQTHAYK